MTYGVLVLHKIHKQNIKLIVVYQALLFVFPILQDNRQFLYSGYSSIFGLCIFCPIRQHQNCWTCDLYSVEKKTSFSVCKIVIIFHKVNCFIRLDSLISAFVSGTHDIHALILGRAITGIQAFTAGKWWVVQGAGAVRCGDWMVRGQHAWLYWIYGMEL